MAPSPLLGNESKGFPLILLMESKLCFEDSQVNIIVVAKEASANETAALSALEN